MKTLIIALILVSGSIQAQTSIDSLETTYTTAPGPKAMTLEELEETLEEIDADNIKRRRRANKTVNLLLLGTAIYYYQDSQNYSNYYYRKKRYQR